MEALIKFIEDQLALATKYHGESYLVHSFKCHAYGAALYASCSAINNGDYKLSHEIDKLWDNNYHEKFAKLESSAG
jgi:hypothetical protein